MRSRFSWVVLLGLVIYGGVTRGGWERYPRVWVDEGWIAEVGWTQAHGAPLGNPSHGPLHRYADRVYWMPPLYFLALSLVDRTGLSPLGGGRWVSMGCGAAALLLLLFWGREVLRGAGGVPSQGSPDPLPDRSPPLPAGALFWLGWLALAFTLDPMLWKIHRSIRFEAMTGMWTIAACAAAWIPRSRGRGVLAGGAAGLAALTHPTGGLAILAAGGILIGRSRGGVRRGIADAATAVAVALVLLFPFALYLLGDRSAGFADVLGQNAPHLSGREAPVVVQWLREWTRWKRYFAWPRLSVPLLLWALTVIAAIRLRAPRGMLWAFGVVIVGIASLPNKSELYLTLAAPFLYLLAAWCGTRLSSRTVRGAAILWVAILAAADAGLLVRDRGCDYARVAASLRGAVPRGASVAGTFVTWFALDDHPYLEFHRRRAGDVADARPAVVVWGDAHLGDPLFARLRAELGPWLAAHADTLGRASSSCYGDIAVLRPRWGELAPDESARWERYGREAPAD